MIPRFNDARDWFFERRLGLFMHFGLYSIEGWHEQDQMRRAIPRQEYRALTKRFNPRNFDPNAILDLAHAAGMGYVCLTAKHHDGFCLWDTELTDYKATRTPYGKDVIKLMADACHERGVRFGIYYSVVDWHHPNYPNQGRHHEFPGPGEGDQPDWDKYMEYLKGQVRELCTRYGEVSQFFWDINVPEHKDPSINAMIRQLQPSCVINDRGFDDGDYSTPERDSHSDQISKTAGFSGPVEACNSVGTQSWGYRVNEDYHAVRHLVESIDTILSKGGNYLLNVGPSGDGRIPYVAEDILKRIGKWYAKVRESYEGCEPCSELTDNRRVRLTHRGNTVYVHIEAPAASEAVLLNPISAQPESAVLLNTGKPLRAVSEVIPSFWQGGRPVLRIRGLPVDGLANETMVVRLDFTELPVRAGQADQEFIG